jgi:hypothetical protein
VNIIALLLSIAMVFNHSLAYPGTRTLASFKMAVEERMTTVAREWNRAKSYEKLLQKLHPVGKKTICIQQKRAPQVINLDIR